MKVSKILGIWTGSIFLLWIMSNIIKAITNSVKTDDLFSYAFIFIIIIILFAIILKHKPSIIRHRTTNRENFFTKALDREYALIKFIFSDSKIWVPYIISFILIILFIRYGFNISTYIVKYIDYAFHVSSKVKEFFFLLILIFNYTFIPLSILMIPYFILAERLQIKYSGNKQNVLLSIVKDYIFSLPYLLLYSIIFTISIIIMVMMRKDTRDGSSYATAVYTLKKTTLSVFMTALYYWLIYKLAEIAYKDIKIIKNMGVMRFYKENFKDLVSIYFMNGAIFALPLIVPFSVLMLASTLENLNMIPPLSKEMWDSLYSAFMVYILLPATTVFVSGWLMASHINMLNLLIKKERGINDDIFVLDK